MGRILLIVEAIPHHQQRYETAGDWEIGESGTIIVRVSDTGVTLDGLLVGIHEAVEAMLCRVHGVEQCEVDAFDLAFNARHDLTEEEPGEDPAAPYFSEHAIADVVERLVAAAARVPWRDYSRRINDFFSGGGAGDGK